jgi:signal transduction histidine kinase/DNA-binding NarL/FixJ family response regulator
MDVSGSAERIRVVTDLLKRAAGRAEMILHFRAANGYELVSANMSAATLFDMPPQSFSQTPRTWEQLPLPLSIYLAQALAEFKGEDQEQMPDYRAQNPQLGVPVYKVTLFHATCEPGPEANTEHWYLFCFEQADKADSAQRNQVEACKLETIGELASGVAHDFNNLIMGIQSNAEAILSDPSSLPEKKRNALINIIRACSSGTSLTRSLLGYAKRQPLTMTQFNLIDMINDVVRIDALALDSAHQLRLDDALNNKLEPILVNGCYSSLSHCLLNLVKNAREAMPHGGKIGIRWEGDDTMARLTVSDTGTGISEEELTRIFQPFYSTKKNGTGLGLAMVKGIMSQHEGNVEIASQPGVGTSVTLVWPRSGVPVGTYARALPAEPRKSTDEIVLRKPTSKVSRTGILGKDGKPKLAFVIDDDELVRGGVQGLLEYIGYKVEGFGRAEAAVAALASNHVPRLILVDYHMPGMDGSEFIRYWFSELPEEYRDADTQILLVSGHPPSQFQEIIRKYSERNVGLLQKPFSLETLQKKLIDFSALRSITTRIRPVAQGRPVPIGNPSMRNALVKKAAPPLFQNPTVKSVPRPRIAGDSAKISTPPGTDPQQS